MKAQWSVLALPFTRSEILEKSGSLSLNFLICKVELILIDLLHRGLVLTVLLYFERMNLMCVYVVITREIPNANQKGLKSYVFAIIKIL